MFTFAAALALRLVDSRVRLGEAPLDGSVVAGGDLGGDGDGYLLAVHSADEDVLPVVDQAEEHADVARAGVEVRPDLSVRPAAVSLGTKLAHEVHRRGLSLSQVLSEAHDVTVVLRNSADEGRYLGLLEGPERLQPPLPAPSPPATTPPPRAASPSPAGAPVSARAAPSRSSRSGPPSRSRASRSAPARCPSRCRSSVVSSAAGGGTSVVALPPRVDEARVRCRGAGRRGWSQSRLGSGQPQFAHERPAVLHRALSSRRRRSSARGLPRREARLRGPWQPSPATRVGEAACGHIGHIPPDAAGMARPLSACCTPKKSGCPVHNLAHNGRPRPARSRDARTLVHLRRSHPLGPARRACVLTCRRRGCRWR